MDRQVQTLLLYRWLLKMVQNSSFCLNNTQITCSALITYNYLHYTELMFTLIKCPLLSKRYLETFISMAEKKIRWKSMSFRWKFRGKEIKKAFKEQDILTLILCLLFIFLYPQNHSLLLPDIFVLLYIKLKVYRRTG